MADRTKIWIADTMKKLMVGMTREWLFNDNITPAKTIVEMMFTSMPENIRSVFFPEIPSR